MSCSAALVRGMSVVYLSSLLRSSVFELYPFLLEMAEVRFESARPVLEVLTFVPVPSLPELLYLACDGLE